MGSPYVQKYIISLIVPECLWYPSQRLPVVGQWNSASHQYPESLWPLPSASLPLQHLQEPHLKKKHQNTTIGSLVNVSYINNKSDLYQPSQKNLNVCDVVDELWLQGLLSSSGGRAVLCRSEGHQTDPWGKTLNPTLPPMRLSPCETKMRCMCVWVGGWM